MRTWVALLCCSTLTSVVHPVRAMPGSEKIVTPRLTRPAGSGLSNAQQWLTRRLLGAALKTNKIDPRSRTGSLMVDGLLEELHAAQAIGTRNPHDMRWYVKLVRAFAGDLGTAWTTFAAFREAVGSDRAITVLGSARSHPDSDNPVHRDGYRMVREAARLLADEGYIIFHGGAAGIMAAAHEGANGRGFGVQIKLPLENADGGLEESSRAPFRHFFGRKLFLFKRSQSFLVGPGGLGTLEELTELETLLQTSKMPPAEVVLLQPPESNIWTLYRELKARMAAEGTISPEDLELSTIASDPADAVARIRRFNRRYHSTWRLPDREGGADWRVLVLQPGPPPTQHDLDRLAGQVPEVLNAGAKLELGSFVPVHQDRPHLRYREARAGASLKRLIDQINALESH